MSRCCNLMFESGGDGFAESFDGKSPELQKHEHHGCFLAILEKKLETSYGSLPIIILSWTASSSSDSDTYDDGVSRSSKMSFINGSHRDDLQDVPPSHDEFSRGSWWGNKSLTSLLRQQRLKKKEDIRLHTASVHAALSVTRLAAAIASVTASKSGIESVEVGDDGNPIIIGNIVASAAALVTAVCAEAAESLGAHTTHVSSAINLGLAIQTTGDMITLTAAAATRAFIWLDVSEDSSIAKSCKEGVVRMMGEEVFESLLWVLRLLAFVVRRRTVQLLRRMNKKPCEK
ncbi:hypothetical protein C1H46_041554 [Malus baccata]|uniref:VAN3-binding protein-like auxin canalisation domain-containing protein n=1 Tax=Malus baccata TaxID=106549 RepID=A0A540KFJ1_MALBA|nr:hypothetical protein C1H46_041554 [Malus baccata]